MRMLILGAGKPVSGESRAGYPREVDEMRNTNTMTYGSVPLP
ncbi:hypothetical protein [Variovorax sp.]|nr:hypothetical protein [Variovorax sp.]